MPHTDPPHGKAAPEQRDSSDLLVERNTEFLGEYLDHVLDRDLVAPEDHAIVLAVAYTFAALGSMAKSSSRTAACTAW
jgi:hypothetical protein